ncbi:hypothetical protein N7G274_000729 [Stereocaulon virgatum]|uniref:Uncharacterized protein n=1 Tax=Stereocaulon virgatum TaxID=373712 RepID=A0ABR4AS64_9LECA
MAPDLNSLPPSPYTPRRNTSSSRRASHMMGPPPAPLSPHSTHSPTLTSREPPTSMDNTGVGVGPGPLRHPRPLTAADLHMQLEKEQEAVVNRLTRELSLLRQQSASVASTTSSASTGLPDSTDQNANHLISGPSHPTPSLRHRSSSSLSTRSANTAATTGTGISGTSGSTVGTTAGVAGSTISGVAPPRETMAPYTYRRESLSRQSSVASRRSEASSPSLSSSLYQGDHFSNFFTHRHTNSASQGQTPSSQLPLNPGSTRSSYVPSTQRYEDAAHHRSELEIVKRENETLRRRIRELERSLSSRRQSESGLRRSDSISTNASTRPQVRRAGTEEAENAVHVGESAASMADGRGH